MINIGTLEKYMYYRKSGQNPLIDWKNFYIDIDLRIAIQNIIFGKLRLHNNRIPIINQKYYEYCFLNKPDVCEECNVPIYYYSAINVSHILTKGSHPEMAHDPRNNNKLCFDCHTTWENNPKSMKVYCTNKKIIEILLQDYQTYRKEGILK